MNRNSKRSSGRARRLLGAFAALVIVLAPTAAALAVDNTATGDVAGVPTAINPSNTFTINSSTLSLVKTAFLPDATQLSSPVTVPSGTVVRFMIYVDNPTTVPVSDVSIDDVLLAGFTYIPGTIRTDASQASGATDAAIYGAVSGAAVLTDPNDADLAGINGTTVSMGTTGGNAQLDLAANSIRAILFDVTIQ